MDLKEYDNQYVKITDNNGLTYEGLCSYYNKEYNYKEFGRNESSLQILNIIFYKSTITNIELLTIKKAPYGLFSDKYGNLEKLILDSGLDYVKDVLSSNETIHIYRLLLCIEDNIDELNKEEIIPLLESLINNDDIKIKKLSKRIINNYS